MKKLLITLLALLLLFGAIRFYYFLTDDFTLSNITYTGSPPYQAEEKKPLPEEEALLASIFAQPFSYLGKGAQCYAFASEDGLYVLKFFKFKHLKPSIFVSMLPPCAYKSSCVARKQRKLKGVFEGHALAYEKDREASQMVYMQLKPCKDLPFTAVVKDKIGWTREIPLREVVFVLQRKGETLRTHLNDYLSKGKVEEARKDVEALLAMYVSEYKKGIWDHDHGVLRNTGFVGRKPFHLDVGKLYEDEKMKEKENYLPDLSLVVEKIEKWVERYYPCYSPLLDKDILEKLE